MPRPRNLMDLEVVLTLYEAFAATAAQQAGASITDVPGSNPHCSDFIVKLALYQHKLGGEGKVHSVNDVLHWWYQEFPPAVYIMLMHSVAFLKCPWAWP